MKKTIAIICLLLVPAILCAQSRIFNGEVLDAIGYVPIKQANIYNVNKGKYAFSNANGEFSILVSKNDTLVISGSVYRQLMVIIDAKMYEKGAGDFLLYHKAFLLKEVKILALNPSYEGFKRDVATMKLPDSYKNLEDVHLSKMDRQNATYDGSAPNILKGTAVGSPITYLYNTFNKKMKMKALANEMESYGDEVGKVQDKYNRKLVHDITGLEGADLMEFMVYCRFSYYDLVRWSREEIVASIRYKFAEYQYYKAVQEDD